MKPRLLMYTACLTITGGAQYTMSLLVQGLARRGYDIIFFTRPPLNHDHRYMKMFDEAGVPVRVLSRFDQFWYVRLFIFVASVLLTIPYALLRLRSLSRAWLSVQSIFLTGIARMEKRYIHKQFTESLDEGKRQNREVILHIWGPVALTPLLLEWAEEKDVRSIYHEMGEADEEYIKMFSMEGTVESINRSDLVICVSPLVAENMRRAFGYKGRIESIYDMIVDPGEDWVKGKKSNGRVTFGAIGRLVPHKRHTDLLYSLKELHDKGYDTALVIASDGPMRGPLEDLAAKLGIEDRVKFLGEFENLHKVMAQFDIFVLTSSSESQCMPVTESMAYGKAVIVSNFGGIPDFVQHEITGLLVPVGDLPSLVQAMQRLLDNPELREQMGRRGRERFLQLFTPEKVIDSIERTYSTLLNGGKN